jgi:hypothetical protein
MKPTLKAGDYQGLRNQEEDCSTGGSSHPLAISVESLLLAIAYLSLAPSIFSAAYDLSPIAK